MADYGTAVLGAYTIPIPALPVTYLDEREFDYGAVYIPVAGGGPAPPAPAPTIDARTPGDYVSSLASGQIPTSRTAIYTALSNVKAVIREIGFANLSSSVKVVKVWIGGIQREPGLSIPASESRGQSLLWTVLPGQSIEVQADGTPVNCFFEGVEEVS